LLSTLEDAGYEVLGVTGITEARATIGRVPLELVLLDVRLHDGDGLEFLGELRTTSPELPVIMATAYGDSDRTISAMKKGAFDYVTKPFDLPALLATVAHAARAPEPASHFASSAPAAIAVESTSSSFIGSSPAMLAVWKSIGRAAASEVPVL